MLNRKQKNKNASSQQTCDYKEYHQMANKKQWISKHAKGKRENLMEVDGNNSLGAEAAKKALTLTHRTPLKL